MSEGIQKLKELGAQKIHETTHINKQYLQAMLHESFEGMNRIHFLGFVSILEKEYDVDLTSLRAKAEAYFNDSAPSGNNRNKIFMTPKKKKNYSFIYVAIAVLVFVAVTAFTITNFSSDTTDQTVQMLDSEIIDDPADAMMPAFEEELNVTVDDANHSMVDGNYSKVDENRSKVDENHSMADENYALAAQQTQAIVPSKTFKMIPSTTVWVGYIDLQTYQKQQKIVSDELALDPEKNWLIVSGHGNLKVEVNKEIKEFKGNKNLRLSYIGGVLSEITHDEFKTLNKGKGW